MKRLPIIEVPVAQQAVWVFETGVPERALRLGLAEDVSGDDLWYALYRTSSTELKWPEQEVPRHGLSFRQDEFHFMMMIAVPTAEVTAVVERLERRQFDFHDWLPADRTDAGYLYELGQRTTWDEGRTGPDRGWEDDETFRQFTLGYHWEHHLDRTVSNGLAVPVPSPWLVRQMQLRADPVRLGRYLDRDGRLRLAAGRSPGTSRCIGRKEDLDAVMERDSLAPLWIAIGERRAWPNAGGGTQVPTRRWNGIMRLQDGSPHFTTWEKDETRPLR